MLVHGVLEVFGRRREHMLCEQSLRVSLALEVRVITQNFVRASRCRRNQILGFRSLAREDLVAAMLVVFFVQRR